MRGYYRLITGVDDVVGNLIKKLEAQGIADNTIIAYMGDNGFVLGEHGLAGKWFPYDKSVRVPLFIYNPLAKSNERGIRNRSIALNIDIAPTFLAYAGVEIPEEMQGKSLQAIIANPKANWRDNFFYEHRLPNPKIPKSESVIGLDYKYVDYYELPDSNEYFFNLKEDVYELNNLMNSKEYVQEISIYKHLLDSFKINLKPRKR